MFARSCMFSTGQLGIVLAREDMPHLVEVVNTGSVNRAYLLCLAGLVHDIGKIGQRASEHLKGLSDDVIAPGYKTQYLPSFKSQFSHFHVLYTGEFLNKSKISNDSNWKFAEGIALGHHKPSTPDQHILARADRLASADARLASEEYESKFSQFRLTPMISPLSELKLPRDNGNISKGDFDQKIPLTYSLDELNLDELTIENYQCSINKYEELWKKAIEQSKSISMGKNPDAVLEKVQALVDFCGWTVPSATNAFPDISLADHSKATALIAAAIGAYYDSSNGEEAFDFDLLFGSHGKLQATRETGPIGKFEEENADKALFRMVIGDLAGIQAFISDIKTEGASKNLKARSFLVDCWADRIAALVLREFGMPEVCRIYSTGGKFLLILPNIEGSEEKLTKLASKINSDFVSITCGATSLHLRLASTPLSQYDLRSKGFGEKLHKLIENGLQKASQNPHLEIENLAEFFSGQEPRDADITKSEETDFDKRLHKLGGNLAKMEKIYIYSSDPGDGSAVKVPCANEWISLKKPHNNKPHLTFGFNNIENGCDGLRWYAGANSPNWHDKPVRSAWGNSKEEVKELIKSDPINKDNFWLNLYAEVPDADKLEKDDSKEPSGLITFDSLSDAAKIVTGFGRVGILRMDVDNLGWLMAKGLDEFAKWDVINEERDSVYSLGRIMSISSLLVKFFSGVLPKVLESFDVKDENGKVLSDGVGKVVHASDLVFIVYSGGDDAFLVGPWFLMPELAMRIRECFRSWTGCNDDLGLSAGIKLVSGKYPISVGADEAGECESAAKNLTRGTKPEKRTIREQMQKGPVKKDRMDFLEFTAGWSEWDIIKDLSNKLAESLKELDDRGFIRLLGKVAIAYRDGIGSEDSISGWLSVKKDSKQVYSLESLRENSFPGRWRPLLNYSVGKVSNESKRKEAKAFANILNCGEEENLNWRNRLSKIGCKREPIEYLATVVRWTDYLGRKR